MYNYRHTALMANAYKKIYNVHNINAWKSISSSHLSQLARQNATQSTVLHQNRRLFCYQEEFEDIKGR
jgi:hypothetical protein